MRHKNGLVRIRENQKLKFIKPVELNQNLGGRPIKCQGGEDGREMEQVV